MQTSPGELRPCHSGTHSLLYGRGGRRESMGVIVCGSHDRVWESLMCQVRVAIPCFMAGTAIPSS